MKRDLTSSELNMIITAIKYTRDNHPDISIRLELERFDSIAIDYLGVNWKVIAKEILSDKEE